MRTRQLDVTSTPVATCQHEAWPGTSSGSIPAPGAQYRPVEEEGERVRDPLAGVQRPGLSWSGQDQPYLADLLLLMPSTKSEAVPPRRVSRHSSLIGRGFGLDKVSEMTSTMHFIT